MSQQVGPGRQNILEGTKAFGSNLALSYSGQNRGGHKTSPLRSLWFSKTNPEFHPQCVCRDVAP